MTNVLGRFSPRRILTKLYNNLACPEAVFFSIDKILEMGITREKDSRTGIGPGEFYQKKSPKNPCISIRTERSIWGGISFAYCESDENGKKTRTLARTSGHLTISADLKTTFFHPTEVMVAGRQYLPTRKITEQVFDIMADHFHSGRKIDLERIQPAPLDLTAES